MPSKLRELSSAIAEYVDDGDVVALEGFTHLIPFAAGHELIRQRRRDLTLVRLTPDIIYDQMIAAGCCRRLVFGYAGNPGVGSLRAFRRAVEDGVPAGIALQEYSHFGLAMALHAGASGLPYMPLRSYYGSDLPAVNPQIRRIACPSTGEPLYAVAALRPDVAVIHVQRADAEGNAQVWGLLGLQREAAFAARRVIVTAEEIVPASVVRGDPNRTVIPAPIVSAVCHVPFGAHPSYAQGYYDRDTDFYLAWDDIARDHVSVLAWLDEWVHGVADRGEYGRKLPPGRMDALRPADRFSLPVNYGTYA
jgi:glutaconate CoA-transferase subunit A